MLAYAQSPSTIDLLISVTSARMNTGGLTALLTLSSWSPSLEVHRALFTPVLFEAYM